MYREYPGLWGSIITNQSTVVSFWSCCHSTNNKIGKKYMKNTVVIFNAGIGALTLGFQNAGYEILKAYEPDRKVIEIYQEI